LSLFYYINIFLLTFKTYSTNGADCNIKGRIKMTSWIFYVGLIVAVLLYAIFSVFLKKPIGLYMATAFHIVLGILSLPSIGLYVIGLAVLELVVGIIMSIKYRQKQGIKK